MVHFNSRSTWLVKCYRVKTAIILPVCFEGSVMDGWTYHDRVSCITWSAVCPVPMLQQLPLVPAAPTWSLQITEVASRLIVISSAPPRKTWQTKHPDKSLLTNFVQLHGLWLERTPVLICWLLAGSRESLLSLPCRHFSKTPSNIQCGDPMH